MHVFFNRRIIITCTWNSPKLLKYQWIFIAFFFGVQCKIVSFFLSWEKFLKTLFPTTIFTIYVGYSYNHHLSCCCANVVLVFVSVSLLFLCLLSSIVWFVCLVHGKHLLLFAFIFKRILCWGEHFDFFSLYLCVQLIFSSFHLTS